MNLINYSILQYKHDCALDEAVNIGVIAFSAEQRKASLVFDRKLGHLRGLYQDFDRAGVLASLKRLQSHLAELNRYSEHSLFPSIEDHVSSAKQVVQMVWPDGGSSLAVSAGRFSVAEHVDAEAKTLYHRFVDGLRDRSASAARREDADVWRNVMERLQDHEGFAARFQAHEFGNKIELDYAAQRASDNQWVGIEPVSFDYMNESAIQARTFGLVGKSVGLNAEPDFCKLLVVIGDEYRNPSLIPEVDWAKNFLRDNAPNVEVLSEREVDSVQKHLA